MGNRIQKIWTVIKDFLGRKKLFLRGLLFLIVLSLVALIVSAAIWLASPKHVKTKTYEYNQESVLKK